MTCSFPVTSISQFWSYLLYRQESTNNSVTVNIFPFLVSLLIQNPEVYIYIEVLHVLPFLLIAGPSEGCQKNG